MRSSYELSGGNGDYLCFDSSVIDAVLPGGALSHAVPSVILW